MIRVTPERLRAIVTSVFQAAGAPTDVAERVAHSLVENNTVGHDSHGVLRVGAYLNMLREGRVDPRGQLTVVRQTASTALLDGGRNFGQITAHRAMDAAIRKAREHDIGWVAIRNCSHAGRLGEYTVQAAEQGFMAMMFSSGSARGGGVAPYLGTSRVFCTNPITWAIPAGNHPPVFMDYATSVCAQGKIQAAIDKGVSIPEGCLLDANGEPTTDPSEQMRGGVMLPFGLHKGYCLSFLVEVVSSGLIGAACSAFPEYVPDFPTVMLVFNIEAFQPLEQFRATVDRMIAITKAARKAPGVDEILVPGEPEWKTREQRLRDGIDLPQATWDRLVQAANRLGVPAEAG